MMMMRDGDDDAAVGVLLMVVELIVVDWLSVGDHLVGDMFIGYTSVSYDNCMTYGVAATEIVTIIGKAPAGNIFELCIRRSAFPPSCLSSTGRWTTC